MARRIALVLVGVSLLIGGCTSGRVGGDLGISQDIPVGDAALPYCAGCHGTEFPWNPPPDSQGNVDQSFRGVGVHSLHLAGGFGAKVTCDTCHVVPNRVDAVGHIDSTLPAEVTFKGRAILDELPAATTSPNGDSKSVLKCENVYCHGASLDGGTATEPEWNAAESSKFGACGACHGIPVTKLRSGAGHTSSKNCSVCHDEVVGAGNAIIDSSKHVDGIVQVKAIGTCNACHGNADNPAPPVDTNGLSDTSEVSVGAHQAHVKGSSGNFAVVACDACHLKPSSVDDPGHNDGKADVAFKGISIADGAVPAWGRDSATCSGTYCHGATLRGGTNTTPKWTVVDGSQAKCGSCHGAPPPSPHASQPNCSMCHSETAGWDGTKATIAHPDKHMNGTVEVQTATECNACHGSETSAAPPTDPQGRSDTTLVTVGAHQSHLNATLGKPVACKACHTVPMDVGDAGHKNGKGDVAFKDLSVLDGAAPSWDETAATCAGTYCHGATLSGGANTTPKWTVVGGDQAKCGNCHGLPPSSPHPADDKCAQCHGDVINEDGSFKDASRHIDGTVDLSSGVACNTCHGNTGNAAPPEDTTGSSDTAKVSVGAHQSHVKGASGDFALVTCDACHPKPSKVGDPGHMDGKVDVVFKGTSVADGVVPSWNRDTATCATTYCHGSTIGGGTNTAPKWTTLDGTQAECGACHSLPPPSPHPITNLACFTCHNATIGPDGSILHPENHVNGIVDVADTSKCNSCHGNADNNAPPQDLSRGTDTSFVTVGAHQKHLKATDGLSTPVACTSCHKVPQTFNDAGHVDTPSPAEVTFSGLATNGGQALSWNRTTAVCTNVYCHGATRKGGDHKNPVWTNLDGSQIECGSCHGAPPPSPHPAQTNCSMCHPETAGWDGTKSTIAFPDKHINGTVEYQLSTACNACHGSSTSFAPPMDTHGQTDVSVVTVGAHQSHLKATLGKPVACAECHVVPASVDDPAHMDNETATVTFGTLATPAGMTPTWNRGTAVCTNAYCHGRTLAGGSNKTPTWTNLGGSQKACGTCHGNPPPGPDHPQSPACGACHALTAAMDGSIKDPSHHIDGTLDVRTTFACNSCHGSADNNAPPVDLTGGQATLLVTVGAHQAHLKGTSNIAAPLTCPDCHKVPATLEAAGHIDTLQPAELTFGAKSSLRGATPAWNRTTAKCSGTYCHGATLPAGGATNTTPTWTTVDNSQDACGTCHGIGPRTGQHPAMNADHSGFRCAYCHKNTVTNTATPAISDKTLHINGTVEVVLFSGGSYDATAKTCTPSGCHGTEDWF